MAARSKKAGSPAADAHGPEGKIPIVTYDAGVADAGGKLLGHEWTPKFLGAPRRAEVSPEILKANLNKFLALMGEALQGAEVSLSNFHIDEIELEVEISAEGTVSLFGSGGTVGGKGSLTLKLSRKP